MKLKLHTQIFIAIALGALVGIAIPQSEVYLAPFGDIFIRLLKMIIVPLVMSSMVLGVVSLKNIDEIRQLGARTFGLFVLTTLLAITVGLVLATVVQPGVGANITLEMASTIVNTTPPSVTELLVGIVPKNIFKSLVDGDMLSIIFFSLFLGGVLNVLGSKAKVLQDFFRAIDNVMIKITDVIMNLAPYGVFALMASIVAKTGFSAFVPLAKYVGCVMVGLLIHALITLPVLSSTLGRFSPFRLAQKMFPALGTSFSTSSSSATLPVTMDCLIKDVGVSNRVTSFSIPLGTTMNMDGTALYQAVACLFIAQVYGIEMGLGKMVVIALTATLASIGAAGIPSAGLVTMAIIMGAVGIPVQGIGLILAVDRILDMFRTSVNVWGNATVATILARFQGETLNEG